LIEIGGIYLDCDVLVHGNFDDLLNSSVVLGLEGEGDALGLCNAVILAEPGASLLTRWYSEYKNFRSKGHDRFWCEHSIEIPLKLARAYPEELTMLGPKAFFWPTWDDEGLARIFASTEPIPHEGVYANHLWESCAWFAYLRDLTPRVVRSVDSNFHFWVRPLIADLPDNLGALSTVSRVKSDVVTRIGMGHIRLYARSLFWHSEQNLRRALTLLRNRFRPLDRVVRNRHRYLDKAIQIAAFAPRVLRAHDNFIDNLHRRRTFQSVYRDHSWGTDGASPFFSGVSSRGEHARSYIKAMVPLLEQHAGESMEELVIVDLGCGDFTIGSALLESLGRIRYIGCDIVPELIAYNQSRFGRDNLEFQILDIVRDVLPDGQVCLVREVLQHLSNSEIAAILPKLAKYKYVYVSEHQPLFIEGVPNPDKPVGAEIRFDWRTGRGRRVELDLPPWNLSLREVIRTNLSGPVKGSIVTHRIISFTPNNRLNYIKRQPNHYATEERLTPDCGAALHRLQVGQGWSRNLCQ
jgi:Methyltransferase domain